MGAIAETYDVLKLENQLCFPLYASAKEVVSLYTPLLKELDLTYTQYIAMMVLWEQIKMPVKDLGERLYLDSGTLTPLLKKLEAKGYVRRERSKEDERSVIISVTKKGLDLRKEAVRIPHRIGSCIPLSPDEAQTLYGLLNKVLNETRPPTVPFSLAENQ